MIHRTLFHRIIDRLAIDKLFELNNFAVHYLPYMRDPGRNGFAGNLVGTYICAVSHHFIFTGNIVFGGKFVINPFTTQATENILGDVFNPM